MNQETYDCYVYRCSRCNKVFFMNKHQNQLKLFKLSCKCSKPIYQLVGEGNFETGEINIISHKESEFMMLRKNTNPTIGTNYKVNGSKVL